MITNFTDFPQKSEKEQKKTQFTIYVVIFLAVKSKLPKTLLLHYFLHTLSRWFDSNIPLSKFFDGV